MKPPILDVRDLHVHYETSRGPVQAVNGVSFILRQGERLGLVGESGSGKSTMALALMRLIRPPGRIVSGQMLLEGDNLVELTDEAMRQVRLGRIAMVAQGAMNSLNPVIRVKDQLRDGLADHGVKLSGKALDERVRELLESVGLRREVANMFPMLHSHPDDDDFAERLAVAQLEYVTSSTAMATSLAENYTGLPYTEDWSYR